MKMKILPRSVRVRLRAVIRRADDWVDRSYKTSRAAREGCKREMEAAGQFFPPDFLVIVSPGTVFVLAACLALGVFLWAIDLTLQQQLSLWCSAFLLDVVLSKYAGASPFLAPIILTNRWIDATMENIDKLHDERREKLAKREAKQT
jgi:hypothetical protein